MVQRAQNSQIIIIPVFLMDLYTWSLQAVISQP